MIMKRFLLLCLLFVPCLAAQAETYRVEDIPNVQRADRTRYVSNPDGILSDEAVAHIDRLCAALREQAVAQVAVVAVDDIAGGDVFDFAIDLFSAWGVGQARNDNGLGILLVKDRREIRFVTGGGLEGVLPDAICKRIQLKYMLPAFRQGDYSLGMVQGVEAVSQLLEGSELDLGGTDTAGDELPAWAVFLIVTGFVVVPMGVILLGYYARKRCPKCHKLTLRQQSSDILKVTPNYRLVEYTYVCSNCGAVVKRQAKNLRDDNFGGGAGGGMIIGGRGSVLHLHPGHRRFRHVHGRFRLRDLPWIRPRYGQVFPSARAGLSVLRFLPGAADLPFVSVFPDAAAFCRLADFRGVFLLSGAVVLHGHVPRGASEGVIGP